MRGAITYIRIIGVGTTIKEGLGSTDMTREREIQQGDRIQIRIRRTSLTTGVLPIQHVPSVESSTQVNVDWEPLYATHVERKDTTLETAPKTLDQEHNQGTTTVNF